MFERMPTVVPAAPLPSRSFASHMAFIAQAPQLLDQYRLSVSPCSTVV